MRSCWIAALLLCAVPGSVFAQSQAPLILPNTAVFSHDAPPQTAHVSPTKGGRDSLKNGAIIGAVVLGSWCAVVCGQGLDNGAQLPLAVAAAAGYGALIGAAIDAMHDRRPGIYFRKRW